MADINKAINLGSDSYFTNYTATSIEIEKKAHASFIKIKSHQFNHELMGFYLLFN